MEVWHANDDMIQIFALYEEFNSCENHWYLWDQSFENKNKINWQLEKKKWMFTLCSLIKNRV
jgi:hypothetical protein